MVSSLLSGAGNEAVVFDVVTGNRRHFPAVQYGTAEVVDARASLARLPVG